MNTALWCLLVVTFLPIILSWVSGYYRNAQLGKVDNKNPRLQNAQLQGAGARAVAAQSNAWEALGMYLAALFAATTAGVAASTIATASLIFVAARIIHGICYVVDQDILRSLAFLVGVGSLIWLFVAAL